METGRNSVFAGPNAVKDFLNPDNNPHIPLVELPENLNPFKKDGVHIFAKLMNMVPLLNVKSLPAMNMLLEAEKNGKLEGVRSIVENSSGNTAFSLAVIARIFGVGKAKAFVSHEVMWGKLQLLRVFGTGIIVNEEPICPDPGDKTSGIYKAKRIGKRAGYFNAGQYDNEANPAAHEKWTGPQIWEQTGGRIALFCAGLGTTGTITGTGRFLKKKNPGVFVLGVSRLPNNPVPGVRTPVLLRQIAFDWKSVTDTVEEAGTKESFEKSLELCRAGIVAGPSSGFALAGLLNFLARHRDSAELDGLRDENGEILAVFICPDSPLPYLNDYFEYLDDSHFPKIKNENLLVNKPKEKPKKTFYGESSKTDSFEPSPEEAYDMIYAVPPDEAWQRLAENEDISLKPKVKIIDIRSRGDFLHFHLPGSERMNPEEIIGNPKNFSRKWKNRRIFLLCPMGIRAKALAEKMRKGGMKAYGVKGGLAEWSAKNLPRWRPGICKT
jgi:cysteine synthase/rhodanese-related sulfurtransferase